MIGRHAHAEKHGIRAAARREKRREVAARISDRDIASRDRSLRFRFRGNRYVVMAGLVPAIPIGQAERVVSRSPGRAR
jgi:hypothetical protein